MIQTNNPSCSLPGSHDRLGIRFRPICGLESNRLSSSFGSLSGLVARLAPFVPLSDPESRKLTKNANPYDGVVNVIFAPLGKWNERVLAGSGKVGRRQKHLV